MLTIKRAGNKKAKVIPIRKTVYIEKPIYRTVYNWSLLTAIYVAGVLTALWLI